MKLEIIARSGSAILAPFAAVCVAIAAVSSPVLPDPGNTGVSKADQEKMGREVVTQVYKEMPVLPDSSAETKYVRTLGQRLAAVIPPEHSWPWEFHVVPQKEINAFAVPGGQMFVNVGTITAANNEAQLAGVMAHEMAHVYMQHSVKQMKKNQTPSLLAGIGQIAGQMMGGVGGALTGQLTQMGAGMWSMKYSRTDEAEADSVGAIILYNAGYDPRAMADFFQTLAAQGGNPPQILSDHPNPGNRQAAISRQLSAWPPKNFRPSSAGFTRTREGARSVKVYTSQEIDAGAKSGQWTRQNASTGATPADLAAAGAATTATAATTAAPTGNLSKVRPSGTYRLVTRGGVSIFYPDNWQVFGSETESGVTLAPQGGVIGGNLAYGVIVNKGRDTAARTLDDAARDLVRELQKSNPSMKAIGAARAVTVDGLSGMSVDLRADSPLASGGRALPERDWLVLFRDATVEGGFVYTIFIAPEGDFGELRPTFESMLRGMSFQQ